MPINYINLADIDRNAQNAQLGDLQIQNAQMARQDRERQIQAQQAAQAQQMQLRDIYAQGGGDLNKTREELYKRGLYEQGAAVDKQLSEQAKSRSDVDKSQLESASKRISLIGNGMKFLVDNPTKENAMMTFNQLRSVGVLSPEQYDEYTAKLPDDPAMIRRGAEVLFRGALDAKDQLAKYETRDTGGAVATQQIDPVTGQVKIVSSISKTQTPDSIASNERMAREGALNRGVQLRGQDLTRRGQDLTNAREMQSQNMPPKTQLSASAQKELFEADEMAQASRNAIGMLREAKKLNNTAYSGVGAKTRAVVASNLGVGGRSADDTINLDNLMTGQALESLKATFGGMPTEGERKILLDIQASADKTPTQRKAILDRAEQATLRRIKFNEEKAKALRSGTYFTNQPQPQNGTGATGEFEAPARNVRSEADKILGL